MHHRCDQCDARATCHQVEILDAVKTVRHLCDRHAAEAGLGATVLPAGVPSDLLAVIGQVVAAAGEAVAKVKPRGPELACPGCGQSLRDFQASRLLGCSECYRTFEGVLAGVVAQAHAGASHHVGKVPAAPAHLAAQERADRMAVLLRMRRRLEKAVAAEDYRLAARLRDEICAMEAGAEAGAKAPEVAS